MMRRAWQRVEGPDDADALIGAVSGGDGHGCTTAEVAEALALTIDDATLQEALEALVDEGMLARWGVGRGALYTCAAPARDVPLSSDAPLLRDAPLSSDDTSCPTGNAPRGDGRPRGPVDMIVLIAEDDVAIAEIVSAVVATAGYTPVVAGHGREALALARLHRPALVITDLLMPHLTGAQLITALRAEATARGCVAAPVILMTASGAVVARAAGADVVLAKPFALAALEALLRRFLTPPTAAWPRPDTAGCPPQHGPRVMMRTDG